MKTTAGLLINKTTDTSGAEFTWSGGNGIIDLSGTIDGAVVTIYVDLGNGFNTNIAELAMSELGLYEFNNIPNGAIIKATVSGAGGTTDLNCLLADA